MLNEDRRLVKVCLLCNTLTDYQQQLTVPERIVNETDSLGNEIPLSVNAKRESWDLNLESFWIGVLVQHKQDPNFSGTPDLAP